MDTRQIDELLEQYIEEFGELPPADKVIGYYTDFYVSLIKNALETGIKITPESLEKAIGNKPYDIAITEQTAKTPNELGEQIEEL